MVMFLTTAIDETHHHPRFNQLHWVLHWVLQFIYIK